MTEHSDRASAEGVTIRDALQALLDEGLDGAELIYRVRLLLLPAEAGGEAQPVADGSAAHPGYQ